MRAFSRDVQAVIMSRAVNEAADRKARVLAKQSIVRTGRFKPSYIQKQMTVMRASSGSPEPQATVQAATDRWSLITNFKPKYARPKRGRGSWRRHGARVLSAQPWGEQRSYKGVFLINKNGRFIPVVRVGKSLKGVYGAAPARELKRALEGEYSGPDIIQETGRYLEVRMRHHINQAANRHKSSYNL